tara:strand:+ start:324 stop:566 length:243 start_codon:yes stop_codon:yes gene_type:complete
MLYFCKYKNIFGKPNEGLRKYRILDISLIDLILTILLGKAIQFYLIPEVNIYLILFWCFFSGILLHRVFCVRTTIDKFLF